MMALLFLGFLLFTLVGRISSGGYEQLLAQLGYCGLQQDQYVELSDGFLRFSLLGRDPADRGSICGALELLVSGGCDVGGESQWIEWRRFKKYCSSGALVGSFGGNSNHWKGSGAYVRQTLGRRILLEASNNGLVGRERRSREHWKDDKGNYKDSSLSSKKLVIALPSAFILCCAFLCPCFQKRGKDISELPLHEMEMGLESTSDYIRNLGKTPGTTPGSGRMPGSSHGSGRMPGSPLRAPPTPLRVPASPSRFAPQQVSVSGPLPFKMKQIVKATQNFSESHVIGEGGFGLVYKAELPNGLVVAVKRAQKEHTATLLAEFSNEVQFLSQIEHQNLVKLLGYIDQENERIIISEYVPNGNLREHLDGRDGKFLDFSQRLAIAIDVAHGLTYLHLYAEEKPIIHRDVKSSNILLTESLRAKVADFGFARSGPTGEDQTHISTAVKGTAGYLDPEYLRTYKLTPKSDVFSFGALLVEIISGRRPVEAKRPMDERVTLRWAFKNYTHGQMRAILDPNLDAAEVHGETLSKLLQLAFECAAPTHNDRPAMREVGERLWDIRREHMRSRSGHSMPSV